MPTERVSLPKSTTPEPFGSDVRAAIVSGGYWLLAQARQCSKSWAAARSASENLIPGQNLGQLQQSHPSMPFGDLHRGTKMSCALI